MKEQFTKNLSRGKIGWRSLLVVCLVLLPALVFGATASFGIDKPSLSVGDTVLLKVSLDTEGQTINVVDGSLQIKEGADKIKVRDFDLAGSDLSQWPRTPSLSIVNNSVSFVGGTPGGFIKKDGLLFKVVFTATKPGKLTIDSGGLLAYLNDGSGSSIPVRSRALVLDIKPAAGKAEDSWKAALAEDHTIPNDFKIEVVQDSTLFNGQKFIMFSTTDDGSGIDYYEVKEGDHASVRSGSPYILQDQQKDELITVYAHDKSGNVRAATAGKVNKKYSLRSPFGIILIIILLIGIVYLFARRRRRIN